MQEKYIHIHCTQCALAFVLNAFDYNWIASGDQVEHSLVSINRLQSFFLHLKLLGMLALFGLRYSLSTRVHPLFSPPHNVAHISKYVHIDENVVNFGCGNRKQDDPYIITQT